MEHKIVWVDKTKLPFSVEALIAAVWITMVASLPLIPMGIDGKKITKTEIGVFVVMWIVFLGGIYLFENILLFQSSHFEGIRSLTTVECVYLMSQILTTVGYGDITPAKPRGQVFVALYVIFSLLVIANVVSQVADRITSLTQRVFKQIETYPVKWVKSVAGREDGEPEDLPEVTSKEWVRTSRPQVPWQDLARSSLVYLFCVVVGCVFFINYPGEGKTVLQGVYMSIITLSTVGFGAVTPVTEGGKAFAAFWMLFGEPGAKALATALVSNRVLRELNLSCNPIGDSGAEALATALASNQVLQTLNLYANNIGSSRVRADIDEALRRNTELANAAAAGSQEPAAGSGGSAPANPATSEGGAGEPGGLPGAPEDRRSPAALGGGGGPGSPAASCGDSGHDDAAGELGGLLAAPEEPLLAAPAPKRRGKCAVM